MSFSQVGGKLSNYYGFWKLVHGCGSLLAKAPRPVETTKDEIMQWFSYALAVDSKQVLTGTYGR